ncbi:glycosyltransferase [Shinella sp. G-2]|uniref:glycosyltransferase n=1 Tax=Shinella sp. G-2 TaxID=3133141 RepID=UPI003CFDD5EE
MPVKGTASHFDIIFVADPRFEGGTSTALAVEIRAAARAGFRCALLCVKGPIIRHTFPVHAQLRAHLDEWLVERLDPVQPATCDLALVHHPSILENYMTPRPRIDASQVIVVLHHPVFDRTGKRQYDLGRVARHCEMAFGRAARFAAVSDVVRQSLPLVLPEGSNLLADDWVNLIDLDEWPARPPSELRRPLTIGRHSRPDIQKWPDTLHTATQAYPTEAQAFSVRVLGGGDYLTDKYGPLPANWIIQPFSFEGVQQFLSTLDFYVYFHSNAWSEAFGRTILEALATGLVCILPRHFEPLFGEAALYCTPREVRELIEALAADPERYREQADKARRFAEDRHSDRLYSSRIEALRGQMEKNHDEVAFVAAPLPRRTCLFASSNGIGMGHLVQQMAIADRLPRSLTPVFATMSYAMRIAVGAGYQCHHFGHHGAYGADPGQWNRVLAEELFDLVSHLRPSIFAYDATALFDGVVDMLATFPQMYSIWVRRPMWAEEHQSFLEHAHLFDAIIEPGELADDFDHGPTKRARERVLVVPPVLHLGPSERLGKIAARRFLNLPEDATVVAVQLGSGANFDMREVRQTVIESLLETPDTIVLEFRSPIGASSEPAIPQHPRHRIEAAFPTFRYSLAFDAAVSAAGYNAFHEHVIGCIPTLFVPNEAEQMDLQVQRARWAEICGYGWLMRRDRDLPHARATIERLLDPAERRRVAERCGGIRWRNGAEEIARFIEDNARLVRSDRDATKPWC